MPSESLGLILAFGMWLAVTNAYILGFAPQSGATQEFHLKIELDIQGGAK